MHIMKSAFCLALLCVASLHIIQSKASMQAKTENEKQKKESEQSPHVTTVISFDIDDVVSGKEKVGLNDYISLVSRIVFFHPMLITALRPQNFKDIRAMSAEIQKSTNGAANIIHALIKKLNDKGYGDLSYYEGELIARSQKPYPVPAMIEIIKKLRAQGYTIIGATNQDYMQHMAYRAHIKSKHQIDFNELFDAVLTTRVNHIKPPTVSDVPCRWSDLPYKLNEIDNIYVVHDREAYKPRAAYFKAEKWLAKKLLPGVKTIIHTDDKQNNIDGANAEGLVGIHFNLPDGNVRKSTPENLIRAIKAWYDDLLKNVQYSY